MRLRLVACKGIPRISMLALARPMAVGGETDAACSPCEINTRIDDRETANIEGHGQDGYVVVKEADPKRDDRRDRLIIT